MRRNRIPSPDSYYKPTPRALIEMGVQAFLLCGLSVALMAGCANTSTSAHSTSGSDPSASSVTVPEVQQGESPSSAKASAGLANANEYFELLATNDPVEIEKAAVLAAPKSIAAGYATHLAAANGAAVDGGNPRSADDLQVDGGTYVDCTPHASDHKSDCVKWTHVEFAADRIANFTVNGQKIEGRLSLGSDDKIQIGKLGTAKLVSSYKSIQSKALYINLLIESKNRPVSITYSATYRDPSGKQMDATNASGPTDLGANSNTRVCVIFANAKTGGVLTFELTDSKTYTAAHAKIKVG